MANARSKGVVPQEQFAKAGSKSQDAALVKVIFNDRVRVLHRPAAISSVDFFSCYDSVAHPIASICLQAWGVSLIMVKITLSVLQSMRFFLRTGFGDATQSYGGTSDDPLGGLGQGNGAAPPAFTAVCSILLQAYIRMGHGLPLKCAITGALFSLAAIIYVDDTDLLHVARTLGISDSEFFEQVQSATLDWGKLAIASGGSLKPAKCFWYMMSFKFKNGRAYYKTPSELPRRQLMVPAPDGSLHPIDLKPATESSEVLGVLQCPAGLPDAHLNKMKQAGLDWADKAQTSPLPRRLARMSHDHMLVPRMRYGIECLLASPRLLSSEMRKVMFRCLPHLGVNRNFKTEFVTLSRTYQGLELVDWPIEKLCADLHVLRSHWDSDGILGNCIRDAYQLLQMETGLEGNIFSKPFRHFGHLATHSWMKILWEYLDFLDIKLLLPSSTNIPPVREDDAPIIESLFARGVRGGRLAGANRVRKFKQVERLSCFATCDGKFFLRHILSRDPGRSNRIWSTEFPSASDFRIWKQAIHMLSSGNLRLPNPLGRFIGTPHIGGDWSCNDARDQICRKIGDGSFALYDLSLPVRFTRSGLKFSFTRYCSSDPGFPLLATVLPDESSTHLMKLHSSSPLPQQISQPLSFLAILSSWENQSLWSTLRVTGNGSWLTGGLMGGTLSIVHDGSYMKKVTPRVCSMAILIRCLSSGNELTCTWSELSTSADNYRGELLGAVCCSLLLRAASMVPAVYPSLPQRRYCDNMGVVKHGNVVYSTLKDGQAQSDLIRIFQSVDRDLPFKCEYVWVESHTDSKRPKYKRSEIEKDNTRVDDLAKQALIESVMSRTFISPHFPFESVRIYAGDTKLTGRLRPFITNHHSRRIAKTVFGFDMDRGSKLVDEDDFDLIFWEVIPKALAEFPSSFKDWLSKHVVGMCGVNRHLSKWKPNTFNICPCCNRPNEDILHITTCFDEGRSILFNQMIDELEEWLLSQFTPLRLTESICLYLRGRNRVTMTRLCPYGTPYHHLALIHDRLGWRSFLEGRISSALVQEMHVHLSSTPARFGAIDWAKGLVNWLIRITHRQWKYRNSVVHYTVEGRTLAEHQEVIDEMSRLMTVDPQTLLPKYRHLFEDEDFEELGSGSTTNRIYWVAAARAAVAASALNRQRRRHRRRELSEQRDEQTSTDATLDEPSSYTSPDVPTEYGLKWKKRRLK